MIDGLFYALPFLVFIGILGYIWWVFQRQRDANGALRLWTLKHNFDSIQLDAHDAQPFFQLRGFDEPMIYRGSFEGKVITIGFGIASFNDETIQPVALLYAQCRLPHPVPGEAIIRPPGAQWLGKLEYTALESTTFRGYNSVWTKPKNLSTRIMSPDFMDWYERQRPRPLVYVKDDRCCILVQRYVTVKSIEYFAQQLSPIIRFIERSGALDKSPASA